MFKVDTNVNLVNTIVHLVDTKLKKKAKNFHFSGKRFFQNELNV